MLMTTLHLRVAAVQHRAPPIPATPSACSPGKCGATGHCHGKSPNIKTTFTKTASDCCTQCTDTKGCAGWVWGKSQQPKTGNHTCALKSKLLPGTNGNCTAACAGYGPGTFLDCIPKAEQIVDLWMATENGGEAPAHDYNGTCHAPTNHTGGGCTPGPKDDHWYGGYEDALFEQHVLNFIETQPVDQPMFLFWAPHIVHAPLEAPQVFLDKFDMIASDDNAKHARQYYHAMVNFADEALANITDMMKAKGMWDDTLMIFSTDNGGPVYANGSAGANNYPM
eukprot:UC1_evm1s1972